ncbi:MAG: succinyl-diaminopimelate desuccinylase [Arenicellales bacterium]
MPISETLTLTQQLIRQASVTPEDADCQNLIAKRLSAHGFECEAMRFGDVDNLWATHGNNTDAPLFIFAGHTDVVPTGPVEQWQFPPFDAHIEGDILYGRGAADMKGGVAAFITATERFVKKHPKHRGQIGFLLTSDEEGPAINGTIKVLETLKKRDISIDYCVLGEPSSTARLGDVIKVGRRGSLGGVLNIIGKQGHIAYPHLAKNPIHFAAPVMDELISIQWDKGNENFDPSSFQISNINAGTGATNVTPGQIEILFNLRFSPEITAEAIQKRIEEVCDRWQEKLGFEYEINWNLSGQSFQTHYGELIKAVETAIETHTGKKPELSTSGGTSDGRFIAPTGAQVIELGPINATIHQIDECVNVKDLDTLSDIYEGVLENLLT